jgi:DNA-binding winged helix-turn-helix (wHTH) protein/TolB-like protein/cytochrome c-type biogenesis protein CcmH/NrfG
MASASGSLGGRERAPFCIGDWLADAATNELRRGDEVVRLEPRAMDLLAVLADRAGAVVSRDELFAAAWPGVVVGDEALSQVVTKLRRALGDNPRAPTYIETIAKRGYRLKASVALDAPTAAPAAPATPTRSKVHWVAWLAAVAMLLAIGSYVAWFSSASAPAASAQDAGEGWIAVTVLPFESIGDGAHGYLARGIGDSLMTELGRLSGLRVINASGTTRGDGALQPRYAVSGSVQREGSMLRIHARLLDARSGEQVWSERFERPFGELFPVQDEIIRKLTEVLPAKVTQSERERLARRHTRNLDAYDHFLRAQALFLVRGARENAEAREAYRRALELDPAFARAYSGLALAHAMDHRLQVNAEGRASLERAIELAESACQIDPDIAEVHWALGFVHAQARRHRAAIAALERAISLNPSFADAYALLGGIHTYVGNPAKSIAPLRMALRFKPDGGYLVYLLLGRAYYFLEDPEQALINLREAAARNPSDVEVRLYLAAAMAATGDARGAAWELEEARSVEPGLSIDAWLESYPLASPPHREKLRRALKELG